jgi:hypothetical protein
LTRPRIRALARLSTGENGGLAAGLPVGLVALLAAVVLVAILYVVASREPDEIRGWAELRLAAGGCVVDHALSRNASTCERTGAGIYRVTFTKSLRGTTAVGSRGTCCPGRISASIDSERTVLVVVEPDVRAPITASILVP